MPEDDKDGIAKVRWLPPLPQGPLVGLWLRGWPLVPAAQTDSVTRKADVDQQLVADVLLQQKSSPQCKAAP